MTERREVERALARVASDGAEIAVFEAGDERPDARPLVLVHGFASDHVTNWVGPGWISPLMEAGFHVIAPDMRGHGASSKPHDVAAYDLARMAGDVAAVIDACAQGGPVALMGYSMGAFISAHVAARWPEKISRLVLAGVGENMLRDTRARNEEIAQGLLAEAVPGRDAPVARQFRLFAGQTGADRTALAACIRAIGGGVGDDVLSAIAAPTLVIAGEADDIARDPQALAARIAGAGCETVPRRDHMRAVGDRVTKQKVLDFLTA